MGSSTRSRGSRNMSGRWAVDCTRTSAYAENGGYIQYIYNIYIYSVFLSLDEYIFGQWLAVWFYFHVLFIARSVPQRHAKAHVRLHRNSKCHVGEQLSFKSPRKRERKKERMTCCFWTCWCSAAIVLQVSRGHTIYPRIGGRACKITGKLKFIFLGASYIWYKQVYCACSYSGTSLR